MQYRLEHKDIVATIKLDNNGKNIQLLFNGELVAVFDEGQQLRYLNPNNMGEWREI